MQRTILDRTASQTARCRAQFPQQPKAPVGSTPRCHAQQGPPWQRRRRCCRHQRQFCSQRQSCRRLQHRQHPWCSRSCRRCRRHHALHMPLAAAAARLAAPPTGCSSRSPLRRQLLQAPRGARAAGRREASDRAAMHPSEHPSRRRRRHCLRPHCHLRTP
eukprot:364288-Chlamydomonas_euryale.AAC.2